MNTTEISMELLSGGQSALITLSTTSAQGPVVVAPTNHPSAGVPVKCIFTPDVNGFARQGVNPVAVADGTDQKLLAGNTYRFEIMPGNRLAVVAGSAGTGSFTPNA